MKKKNNKINIYEEVYFHDLSGPINEVCNKLLAIQEKHKEPVHMSVHYNNYDEYTTVYFFKMVEESDASFAKRKKAYAKGVETRKKNAKKRAKEKKEEEYKKFLELKEKYDNE